MSYKLKNLIDAIEHFVKLPIKEIENNVVIKHMEAMTIAMSKAVKVDTKKNVLHFTSVDMQHVATLHVYYLHLVRNHHYPEQEI